MNSIRENETQVGVVEGQRCKFIIENPDAWAETMDTAREVRTDAGARQSYLGAVSLDDIGEYAPLYFLLQRSGAGELSKEISDIITTERLTELSPADSLNRSHVSRRVCKALCNAMLKASAEALNRPCFLPEDVALNVRPVAGSVYYFTDYILITEIAEAASVLTTAGFVAEAVIVVTAAGEPLNEPKRHAACGAGPTNSDVLRAVTHPGECRVIAEFLSPYLSARVEQSRRATDDVRSREDLELPACRESLPVTERARCNRQERLGGYRVRIGTTGYR